MSRLVLPAAALLALVFGAAVRGQDAAAEAAASQAAVAARIAAAGGAVQVFGGGATGTPTPDRQIPVGTGAISGTVTAADTGRPVRRARVTISGPSTVPITARGARAGATATGVARGVVPGAAASPAPPAGLTLNRTVLADAQGHFSFDHLPGGSFTVTASAAQYLMTTYGQKKPDRPGVPIQLSDGQKLNLAMTMIRSGVITGNVRSEDGDVVVGAQVRALRYTRISGVRRLAQFGAASTDDRGIYRLINLQPGEYVVSVTSPSTPEAGLTDPAFDEAYAAAVGNRGGSANGLSVVTIPGASLNTGSNTIGYAPSFYPGTATVTPGSSIVLGAGEERSGVDLTALAIRAVNLNGVVMGYTGQPNTVQVSLLSEDPTAEGISIPSVRVAGADGKFTLRNVPPGQYTLLAQTVPAPQPANMSAAMQADLVARGQALGAPVQVPTMDDTDRMWARASITVDGQSNPLISISMQPGRTISGSVHFEMASPPDMSRAQLTVTLTAAPGAQTVFMTPPRAVVGPDGRFVMRGIIPGRYTVRASGGTMKSSVINGEDTLDFPLVVNGDRDFGDAVLTLTDRISELSGILTDAAGKPATDYTVVIAPGDERFWTPGSRRVFTMRPGTNGQFIVRALPAGDYLIAAVTDIEQGEQFDPEFLRQLTGASARVSIGEGARVTQNLRVAQ